MLWNILYKNNGNVQYIVSCKNNTVNTSYCVQQNKLMLLSDCAVCGKKNQASLKIKELVD